MFKPEHDFVPAEWDPQDGVLITWPHPDSDWADVLEQVEPGFAAMATTISRYEAAVIICRDPAHRAHIEKILAETDAVAARLQFAFMPTNDTWSRDFGPIGVIENAKPGLVNFRFNGWGNRYPSDLDNAINGQLNAQGFFAAPMRDIDFILEGGSIESDGAGTLLTTERCLLNKNRNPGDREAITAALLQYLPIQRVLWLQHGVLRGDDTDSHIDNLARFVAEDTIVYLHCDDPADEHYRELHSMAVELSRLRTADGTPYKLKPLPMPQAIHSRVDGRRLPASYVNFLIINGAVLVPRFDDPADAQAARVLADCFPDREIIAIDSRGFIEQNGGIHCLTMQLATGSLKSYCD